MLLRLGGVAPTQRGQLLKPSNFRNVVVLPHSANHQPDLTGQLLKTSNLRTAVVPLDSASYTIPTLSNLPNFSNWPKMSTFPNLSTVPGCSDIPVPFESEAMNNIYTDGRDGEWRHRRQNDLFLLVSSDPPKYCGALSRLLGDGLKWNLFGIDFSDVVQKRGLTWTMDEDIQVAMAMYWGPHWNSYYSVVQVDYEMQYRPRDMNMFVYGPADRFSSFFRDGYLKIPDFGVDIGQLREEIRVAKKYKHWNESLQQVSWQRNMHFHALDPLINNKAILELLSVYMGSDIVINGYQYVHKHENASSKDNRNIAEWHHDGCGRRVKLFLYMHDVDENRMPTEIAAGSHKSLKYMFGQVGGTHSRPWFNNAAVEKEWKTEAMVGPAGGGFIFDPNTVHRANIDKPHLSRDIVIIDVSSSAKSDLGIPPRRRHCPLYTWKTESINSKFEYVGKSHGAVTSHLLKKNQGRSQFEEYYKTKRSSFHSDEKYYDFIRGTRGDGTWITSTTATAKPATTNTAGKPTSTAPKKSKNLCGKSKSCKQRR